MPPKGKGQDQGQEKGNGKGKCPYGKGRVEYDIPPIAEEVVNRVYFIRASDTDASLITPNPMVAQGTRSIGGTIWEPRQVTSSASATATVTSASCLAAQHFGIYELPPPWSFSTPTAPLGNTEPEPHP